MRFFVFVGLVAARARAAVDVQQMMDDETAINVHRAIPKGRSLQDAFSGISIAKDNSCLWMGSAEDVALCRDGEGSMEASGDLNIDGDLSVTGAVTVSDATFDTSSGSTETLQGLEVSVSANAATSSANANTAASNAAATSANAAAISSNLQAIADAAAAISDNAVGISSNGDSIASNAASITDLVAAISANVDSISANTAALSVPGKLDDALKEARCSRVNCCTWAHEWVDDDTMHCWDDSAGDFEDDPCSCVVKIITKTDSSWKWHQEHCEAVLGGQMTSIHSDAMAEALVETHSDSTSIFIALHDYSIEDVWLNADGTPTNWVSWNSGEPNDSSGEDCAEIYPSTGAMNDIDCTNVYDSRDTSACTFMKADEKNADATMDTVLREARCSRINCCHEEYELFDDTTVHCWRSIYDSYESDPCSCELTLQTTTSKSWKWHNRQCIDSGGQLTSIHTDAAASAVSLFADSTSASRLFYGLHDQNNEDFWMHTDGTPANYINWNSGEPNDSSGEDCGEVDLSSHGVNDIDCDAEHSSRAGVCTRLASERNLRDVTEDMAMKEAICARSECCNDDTYEWVDSTTLKCWKAEYFGFDADPCGCTVRFVSATKSWREHERYCVEGLGGQLMSIHSDTAATRMTEISNYFDSSSVYIGIHDYFSEDSWMWTDGTEMNWASWNSGEPNDSSNEDCAEIYPSTGSMNDIDCDTEYSTRYISACLVMS